MKPASIADRILKVVELYESGLSTRDIAPFLGVSHSTVSLDLRRAGVETNSGARISAKMRGRQSPRKGAVLSDETKAKISAFRAGKSFTTGTKRTPEQREKMRQAMARRMANDPDHLAKLRAARRLLPPEERDARKKARDACKRMIRRVLTMARIRKSRTTESLLGYTKEQLRAHLEAQFRPGMSWSARESFHIDHDIPVADFFRRGIFDPALINALTNLKVLTPEENRAKGDRLFHPAR